MSEFEKDVQLERMLRWQQQRRERQRQDIDVRRQCMASLAKRERALELARYRMIGAWAWWLTALVMLVMVVVQACRGGGGVIVCSLAFGAFVALGGIYYHWGCDALSDPAGSPLPEGGAVWLKREQVEP